MRNVSRDSSRLLAAAALLFAVPLRTAPAQGNADQEAALRVRLAEVAAQLEVNADSGDLWFRKAQLHAELGESEAVQRCREELIRLHTERLVLIDVAGLQVASASARQPGRSPMPRPMPTSSALGRRALVNQVERSRSAVAEVSGTTIVEQLRDPALDSTTEPGKQQVETAVREGLVSTTVSPEEVAKGILAAPTATQAVAVDATVAVLNDALALSEERAGRGEAEEQVFLAIARRAARALVVLDAYAEAFDAVLESAKLHPRAQHLVTMARDVLTSWVASLEREREELQRRAAELEALFARLVELHEVEQTIELAEQGAVDLAKSRHGEVEQQARELLQQWARLRAQRAEQQEQLEQWSLAAHEWQRAWFCDESSRAALAKAAELRQRAGEVAAAVRLLKLLAGSEGEFRESSQDQLSAMWLAVKEPLRADLKVALEAKDGFVAEMERILAAYPIMAGKEEDEVRSGLRGNVDLAKDTVRQLRKNLAKGALLAPEEGGRHAPQQGTAFSVTATEMQFRWVAGSGIEDGFWCASAAVNTSFWDSLRSQNITMADSQGICWVSHRNAKVLLEDLNRREGEAQRLPADFEYALPSLAQLERLRDASGRLPFDNVTHVMSGQLSKQMDRYGPMPLATPVQRGTAVAVESWRTSSVYRVGVVFVLANKYD